MAMRLERLYCTACNAPLKVDTKLCEGDVVTCMYCGASFILSGNETRTVNHSVVNNHYHVQRHSHSHYHFPATRHPMVSGPQDKSA